MAIDDWEARKKERADGLARTPIKVLKERLQDGAITQEQFDAATRYRYEKEPVYLNGTVFTGEWDKSKWGTKTPPLTSRNEEHDYDFLLQSGLSGPRSFTRDGVEYDRMGSDTSKAVNWDQYKQYLVFDPEYGYGIPSWVRDNLQFKESWLDGGGAFMLSALPMAYVTGAHMAATGALGGTGGAAATGSGATGTGAGAGAIDPVTGVFQGTGGLGSGLGTGAGTVAAGGATEAGLTALNSFDTGAMAEVLGTNLTTAEKIGAAIKTALATPGVTTAQTLSNFIKSTTGLDIAPGVLSTLGKLGVAGFALASGSGGSNSSGGVGSMANAQSAAANDAMALAREQWAWNKARADEVWPQTKALIQQQLDIGNANAARAKSEWDTYQSLYLPVEKKYVEQMGNWDTPDRRTQRIQEATADVARGYDAARGTMERGLARSGVRAGGAGFTQAMGDLARSQAADIAGAQNNARRQVEAEGIAGLERVTNIGRGRPSTSFAADQLALSAGNSANQNQNQNTAVTNAGLTSASQWFNTGLNALNSAANVQQQAYRNKSDNSANIGRLLGQLFFDGFADGGLVRRGSSKAGGGYSNGGLVRRAHKRLVKMGYADGGMIHGPGTSTSDSIPAVIDGQEPTALSTGEAVLNAEAVQIVGPEFVERINEAGLQRRQRGGGQTIEGQARRVA